MYFGRENSTGNFTGTFPGNCLFSGSHLFCYWVKTQGDGGELDLPGTIFGLMGHIRGIYGGRGLAV